MATNNHKLISDILQEVEQVSGRKNKIEKLRSYDNVVPLKSILKGALDDNIVWLLPEGEPPFKSSDEAMDDTSGLYKQFRKFYIFTKGKNSDNINQIKREILFIEMLESLHPKEANLMLAVKDKKIPYKGITKKLVQESFPGLIDE